VLELEKELAALKGENSRLKNDLEVRD